MENAIKAIYIGAGTLIAVMVLSVFVYMFRTGARFGEAYDERKAIEQIQAFNAQFEQYMNESKQTTNYRTGFCFLTKGNTVSDVISCANLVLDINNKNDYDPQNSIRMDVEISGEGAYYIAADRLPDAKNEFFLKRGSSYYKDFYHFLERYNNVRIVDIQSIGYTADNETIYEYYFDVKEDGITYSEDTGKVNSITFEAYKTQYFDNTEVWRDSL